LLAVGITSTISTGQQSAQLRAVARVAPAAHPAIGNAGRWIVDSHGRVVVVHGFNLVDKVAPYEPAVGGFGESDARFLQRHGFNAVRLGVIPEAVEPRPGHFDDDYLRSIRRTEQLLARHGIRSLLDFHQDLYNEKFQGEGLPAWMIDDDGLPVVPKAGFPGNYFLMPALQRAFANLWANAPGPGGVGLGTRYIQLVHHVATFFHDVPGLLGYDIFNEPFPGSDYLACFPPLGCPSIDRNRLEPFMSRAIRAVHRADPHRLAFFEPWVTFDYGAPTGVQSLPPGPVGMSFHDYCLGALGLPSTPVTQPVCNDLVESRVVANALTEATRTGNALLLSEFGAETDVTDLREIVDLADAHGISWLEWAYCACGDPTGSGQAESLVLNAHRPPRGSNVNRTTLATLDEPYPQLVSGTPRRSSFNPSTAAFTVTYSTRSPTGRQFVAGARTRIWIPSLHYRHGYRVRVHGGRVASRRNAARLIVRQRGRPATVTVTVRPAS
jgi:endoglycosylceramidase